MAKHTVVGTAAPATAPTELAQHFVDTATPAVYISTGTATTADWQELQQVGLLGTIAIQDANNVAITGGSITNLTTLELPVSATPAVATDGEIALDTTVADFSHGVIKFYGTEEQGIVSMPIAQFTAPTDGYAVTYNAANDEFALAAMPTASTLQGTGLDADAAGFRGIPQNAQTGNYTTVAADAGKHIYHASGAGAGDTYTIDSNANVAYEIGTAITFVNMDSNAVSIAITSDTMYLAGTGTTGTRTLAQYGIATALKTGTTEWLISGTGLT